MKSRSGFTLVEIVVALTILLVVMLSLVTMTGKTVHVTTVSDREQAAIQLASDRLDEARSNPSYAAIDTLYAGTETGFASLPGFTRTTTVTNVTTGGHDFKKITVSVDGPGLLAPIERTASVAP